ncbi:MAG: right-handed parallel beta-helix repeat-containing protein, partial [bacterium]
MGQGSFSQDDGKLTLTLNDAILLPENTSITWGIFYQFQLDENNLPVNSTFTYLFDANPIAVPQNYSPGIVSGKASAEKATGWVPNYNRDVFGNINEAIQSDKTKKGDNVIVCPGEFSEEIIIDKSIHLISYKGKEETSIKTTNPNNNTAAVRIISDDVIIENLTFKESFSGIDIQIGKNISIKDCEFDGNRFHLLGESSVSNVTVKNNLFTNSNV